MILACLVAGCVVDEPGPDLDCSDGKCDDPVGNGSLVSTGNRNVTMYGGYTPLFDRSASQCVTVDPALSKGAQVAAGSVSEIYDVMLLQSREELARQIGIDLGVKVKYPLTSVDLGLGLVDRFRSSATTTTLLLRLSHQYSVVNQHGLKLTDAAATKLAGGIDGFVRACGTHYVNGIRFGGHVWMLITYEARDEQTAFDLRANLGLQAGVVAKVDAQLEAKVEKEASSSGVSVTVSVASEGFLANGQNQSSSLVADLIGSGISAQTFAGIDQLRAAMRDSVAADKCRDQGGDCPGGKSTGFFDNTQRNARPIGIDVGFYDGLLDVNEPPATWKRIAERTQLVERFVRDWGALEDRLLNVYRGEIEPFQLAADKGAFQIGPDGIRVRDPAQLVPTAAKWADRFSPPIGSRIGTTYQQVRDAIQACWTAASIDLLGTSCVPGDASAKTTAGWQAVDAMLGAYNDERILPLQFRVGTITGDANAAAACQALSTPRVNYRLPASGEVGALAPLVGFGAIDWTGTRASSIWFSHGDPAQLGCPGSVPAFRNSPLEGGDTIECLPVTQSLRAVCVPATGPLPLVTRP